MSNSPSTTYLTALCCQKLWDASRDREPRAAGKKPPAQINATDRRCTGRMNADRPNAAASVENGSIHTAESCIKGVITVLETDP
mmetsp:Transcript_26329/g.59925  ORF Transcript_26329/g.59925 Transcript_26329/m.59925 type:complete len:84 (+) Transcript_26329:520-771(+)